MASTEQFWLSRRLAPGCNGIGRGWVVSIITPTYTGEFEYKYIATQNISLLARGMVCGYVSLVDCIALGAL